MVVTSAPGKLILLGEHAVVFGEPAIALAIDLRLKCSVKKSEEFKVNGEPLTRSIHSYIYRAVQDHWSGPPLSIDTRSDIPSGSGLGSSASVTVATITALLSMQDRFQKEYVARSAFEVESEVQGRASPIDTSICTNGEAIFLDRQRGEGFLWEIRRDERVWFIHHCGAPRMSLVIGYTGFHAPTGPLVAKVKDFVDSSSSGGEVIEEIGQLSVEGLNTLSQGDKKALGRIMDRNQELLSTLGVSSPELDRLIEAVSPYSYGAKLTGAGGGGCMVALTDEVDRVCHEIRKAGGKPYVAHTGADGVMVEGG